MPKIEQDGKFSNLVSQRVKAYEAFISNLTGNVAKVDKVVTDKLVTRKIISKTLQIPGGNANDILLNDGTGKAVWSTYPSSQNQQYAVDIQTGIFNNNVQNNSLFHVNSILATLNGNDAPAAGRTITFTNNTAATTLSVFLTAGAPYASGPSIIATLAPAGGTFAWPIPVVYNWSGNFAFLPSGKGPAQGSSLFELGLNQIWSGNPQLRDTFDISCVPPGLGSQAANGPHSACTALSIAAGFTPQQANGYSVGILVTPPPAPIAPPFPLVTMPVTTTDSTGNGVQSINFPNDTAFPKQQTGWASGNYTVSLLDPVVVDI